MTQQKSWRHLINKPMSFKEYFDIVNNLEKMPDQAVALVCGAMVERGLEKAIANRLAPLKRRYYIELFGNGPLSSFMAKIKMAHALSVIGPAAYTELNNIREIRNAFAHSVHPIKFTTKRVVENCKKLKICDMRLPHLVEGMEHGPKTPRDRYIFTTFMLWFTLNCSETERPKRRSRDLYTRRYLK